MSKIHFEKLTPNKDIDLNTYEEALDFIFEDDEIKNIAITGSYSAGKSSVIESYKDKHKNKKFLHISLANFESIDTKEIEEENQDNEANKENIEISERNESVLEGKILNQLIHQIDSNKIPQTNFKVKRIESNTNILKATSMIIIFIVCSLHIVYNSQWSKLVEGLRQFYGLRFLLISTKSIGLLFSISIIISILTVALFNVIKMHKNKSIFKKFNLNGNEIEIFENSDESYFDKYLNEVIYIFENSGADVIVFEDIDRYNTNEIFQRLREINTLINAKRIIRNNEDYNSRFKIFNNFSKKLTNIKKVNQSIEPLKFLYLVRDDIFISKDRTKFFDFIMPVVPVIDSSNSYDKFISHFKKGNIFDNFDEYFLQGISLYVDDMRILKNIYNEFVVYYNRIGTTEQDYNKLLAMVVYKNIFPRDFSDTQINIGFISTLFGSKEMIISDEIIKIENQISKIKDKINLYKVEHLKKVDELDKIYTKSNYHGAYIDTKNPEYIERKEIVELIEKNKLEEMESDIKGLNEEKIKLRSERMSNLITRENIDSIFNISYKNFLNETNEFIEIKSSHYFELIKYLVRNGYIDETYEDYMTYFYENSLTKKDKMFLRSVTDRKAKEWSYIIDNPRLVLSRLREKDFEEIETLNFSLFKYIINTQNENEKYLKRFVYSLKKESQFTFLKEYYTLENDVTIYIKTMHKYWNSFIEDIYECEKFSYEDKKKHIVEVLYYFEKREILEINKNEFLTQTISTDDKFLEIQSPNIPKLIDEFKDLNIEFLDINVELSDRELFVAVYKNNLYEFNYRNIALMLKYIFNVDNEADIKHKNYSKIIENQESELLEFVNDNIQIYMKLILDNCDGQINDTHEAILKLTNNSDIDIEERKEYIKVFQTKLNDLYEIEEKKLWNTFLQNGKIEYTLENILTYYFNTDGDLNEILIDFINSDKFNFELSSEYIDEKFGEESAQSLFTSVVSCESIKEENYRNILEQLKFVYPKPSEEVEDLSDERIKILIELDKLKVTLENIQYLQDRNNNLLEYFIELNIEEYLEFIEELPQLKIEELMNLLSTSVEDRFKKELVSNYKGVISISHLDCSDDVKNFIIKNKFDESDLNYLINNYVKFNELIKESIKDLTREYVDIIVNDDINLSYSLLINLMCRNSIEEKIRLKLLINNTDKMSRMQFKDSIEVTNLEEYKKIFNNGRPKLEVNDINRQFLDKCRLKNWISDFTEDEGLFKISRRGVKKNLSSHINLNGNSVS